MYNKVKRLLDIFFSLICLPFFALLFVLISFFIKKEDKGPVFYKSERLGKDAKIFKMYKFRSMKVNSKLLINNDGSTYNSSDDLRVTKIGRIIRETSIDEVPQLINVLKGDMSCVGPRASIDIALKSYKDDEVDKMKVKPGITGLTQAYYRNNIPNREKRLKDAWYANNQTFILDLKIVFKTLQTVLKKDNLYSNQNSEDIL